MQILITGATGLLGSHLTCHLLKAGYDVVGIRRNKSDLSHFKRIASTYDIPEAVWEDHFEWRNADIRDILEMDRSMEDIDAVVHTAALVSFHKKDKDRLLKVNQEGTANIVNACLKAGVQKLVHVSSTGVFPPTDQMINETMDFNPDSRHTFYGLTKHLAELEVYRGQEEGLNVAIVNPCVILGFGNWNDGSSRLFRQAQRSFPFYSLGSNAFVGVEDVCITIEQLLSPSVNGRYLCIGENLPFRDVQNMMADAFSARRPYIRVSKGLTGMAWRIGALLRAIGIETLITRESARSANRVQRYDASRAVNELGIAFTPIQNVINNAARHYKEILKDTP